MSSKTSSIFFIALIAREDCLGNLLLTLIAPASFDFSFSLTKKAIIILN